MSSAPATISPITVSDAETTNFNVKADENHFPAQQLTPSTSQPSAVASGLADQLTHSTSHSSLLKLRICRPIQRTQHSMFCMHMTRKVRIHNSMKHLSSKNRSVLPARAACNVRGGFEQCLGKHRNNLYVLLHPHEQLLAHHPSTKHYLISFMQQVLAIWLSGLSEL